MKKVLRTMRVGEIKRPPSPSFLPYAGAAVLAGAGSYFLTRALSLAVWQVWGATIAVPAVLGGTLLSAWKNEKD